MFSSIGSGLLLTVLFPSASDYNETIGFTQITASEHFQILEENYVGPNGDTELANEGGVTHCVYNVASKVRENYETYEVELFYLYDNARRLVLNEGIPCKQITFFEGTSDIKSVRKISISQTENWVILPENIEPLPPDMNIIQLASAAALKIKREHRNRI